jgi:restriction system protein
VWVFSLFWCFGTQLRLHRDHRTGEVRISDVVAVLGGKLGLTEAELSELLPSGKQTTFANRVNWAKSYLGKAGLINLTKRAYFEISERGRAVLANPPLAINVKFLESFPEFKAFRETAKGDKSAFDQQKSIETGTAVSCREIHALSGLRCAGFEHHP